MQRQLEPEVMDTPDEARDYNEMDHAEVNRRFVDDLLHAAADLFASSDEQDDAEGAKALDLGTGTALIPIELCRQSESCRVMAVDLAVHMLDLARYNIEAAGLIERIYLERVDAKQLPFADGEFDVVMSNSIVHHIPEPIDVLREAVRVAAPGGWIFIRDLARPSDEAELERLTATYAGEENEHARGMFADSLRAALTLQEMRRLVGRLGFPAESVAMTSDRHWTWSARASDRNAA